MKRVHLYPLLLLALVACASARAPAGATFVVVRHAEKTADGTRDSPLNQAGLARARALAQRLAGVSLVAAYATPFKRTRQTAQPSATLHGLAVTSYDPATPANDFAARLRAEHGRGVVLVVGHSNTVSEIVSALCTCSVAAMGEDEYDRIYTVHIGKDGRVVLDDGRQPHPPAATLP